MRTRIEPFGAWVRLSDPDALVALDREASAKLGLDGGSLWIDGAKAPPPRPLEVHVAVTARCPAGCEGCYLDAKPDGLEPAFAEIEARLEAVARLGAFTVAFGGGEPLSRADIGGLAERARELGLVPVMTTSGIGLTRAKAETLRAFAQINVSFDGIGDAYEAVRGWDGRSAAERAIRILNEVGIPVGANTVITRQSFSSLETTADYLASLGVRELQLLRYKPAGRAASLDYLTRRLSPEQVSVLHAVMGRIVRAGSLSVRIDCAMVPLLSEQIATEEQARALERFGVFGCEAGRHLAASRNDGKLAPCSFTDPAESDVRDVEKAWARDPGLETFRAYHRDPPEPCASCPLRSVCRGGCQVVSQHLRGSFQPDPECPRVRKALGEGS